MAPDPPFIYIAAIRRTGSKVLSYALSQPPMAHVFREPGLARGNFNFGSREEETFAALGLDLPPLLRELPKHPRGRRVRVFRDSILPLIHRYVSQIGIKEIRNQRWQRLAAAFPDMKVVVTARDPRDIFLSLAHKAGRQSGRAETITPTSVAEHIGQQFDLQREMLMELDCHRVRYEDLCTDQGAIEAVKAHVGSQVPGLGLVPMMEDNRLAKGLGAPVHEGSITTRRVARWKSETDPALQQGAEATTQLLGEYMEFWGYEVNQEEPGAG